MLFEATESHSSFFFSYNMKNTNQEMFLPFIQLKKLSIDLISTVRPHLLIYLSIYVMYSEDSIPVASLTAENATC